MEDLGGQGTIYSYSIVRLSYHPFFRGKAPYAVAYVDLDEGPRFLTNVVGVDDPAQMCASVSACSCSGRSTKNFLSR